MAARKLIDLTLLGEVTSGFKSYVDTTVETAVTNGTTDLIAGVEIKEGVLVVTKKNGETQQFIITTPCTVCATQTNTASTEDIAAMLKDSTATASGDAVTNQAGCSIETASNTDIDTLVNDPDNLETTTTNNTFYTDDCIATTATTEEAAAVATTDSTEYTSSTMSVSADGE